MLTGEYAVLDGAKAISLPTKQGQHLSVTNQRSSDLTWKSLDHKGNVWFEAKISFFDFSVVKTTHDEHAEKLTKLFKGAVRLNSDFLSKWSGFKATTKLDFPIEWGLGSSSSLTNIVAQWADVNPLLLHFKINSGSGYDVATSAADYPITYQLIDDSVSYTEIDLEFPFFDNLYFVHLNRKQSSEAGIKYYLKTAKGRNELAKEITTISEEIMDCRDLRSFNKLLNEHEKLVSKSLRLSPMGTEFFSDFWGQIKSLGAWGGDFVLATSDRSEQETEKYFKDKGYHTVVKFDELFEFHKNLATAP